MNHYKYIHRFALQNTKDVKQIYEDNKQKKDTQEMVMPFGELFFRVAFDFEKKECVQVCFFLDEIFECFGKKKFADYLEFLKHVVDHSSVKSGVKQNQDGQYYLVVSAKNFYQGKLKEMNPLYTCCRISETLVKVLDLKAYQDADKDSFIDDNLWNYMLVEVWKKENLIHNILKIGGLVGIVLGIVLLIGSENQAFAVLLIIAGIIAGGYGYFASRKLKRRIKKIK